MRPVVALLALAVLSGCAGYPGRPDPWSELSAVAESPPPTTPLSLPPWPPAEVRDGGAWFDAAGMRQLSIARETAEANTDLAARHAEQVAELRRAYAALVEAGSAEHDLAEIRAYQLEDERRARLWDRWLWLGIGLLGIAVAD